MAPARFAFPQDTQAFLTEIGTNNTKAWFDANRARYESAYVEPAKALVEAIAPGLDQLVPGISAEPRINGSIFRINRDTRFSTDKTPYKDHLDFWFWEGERKRAVSGLFLRIAPDTVIVGAGAHGFDRRQLAAYRDAVTTAEEGDALVAVVADLEGSGHPVYGETYSRLPRGFIAEGARGRLLRHSALHAIAELPAEAATEATLVAVLLVHWRAFAPLHSWLVSNLQ